MAFLATLFLLLLLPYSGYAFIVGVPYKKNDICNKIYSDVMRVKSVWEKAHNSMSKNMDDIQTEDAVLKQIRVKRLESSKVQGWSSVSKGYSVESQIYNRMSHLFSDWSKSARWLSKLQAEHSKAYRDSLKYKCFNSQPACKESLKDSVKLYAKLAKGYSALSKANSKQSKKLSALSVAYSNMSFVLRPTYRGVSSETQTVLFNGVYSKVVKAKSDVSKMRDYGDRVLSFIVTALDDIEKASKNIQRYCKTPKRDVLGIEI